MSRLMIRGFWLVGIKWWIRFSVLLMTGPRVIGSGATRLRDNRVEPDDMGTGGNRERERLSGVGK
jgi:hypothetical protein